MATDKPMPDAPPSYEQSVGPGGAHMTGAAGAGGFAPPPDATKVGAPYPNMGAAPQQAFVAQGQGPYIPPGTQQVVVVVNPPNFGPNPVDMTCPHCQSHIRTSTDSEPGPLAWIFAGILCIVGLWPCACVPCCIESLNSVTHKCPNCKNFLGRYKGGM